MLDLKRAEPWPLLILGGAWLLTWLRLWYQGDFLGSLSEFAQIVIAGFAVFAGFAYFQQKEKDRRDSVMAQVNFFRKEVIPEIVNLNQFAAASGVPAYYADRIEKIGEFNFKWAVQNGYKDAMEQQDAHLMQMQNKSPADWNVRIYAPLDAMEEFAVRVLTNEQEGAPELISLHVAFITNVEILATAMFRYTSFDPKMYTFVQRLYGKWRKHTIIKSGAEIRAEYSAQVNV